MYCPRLRIGASILAFVAGLIFLDFDGVLNHPGTWAGRVPLLPGQIGVPVEPACMARLNRIVARTSAQIVISSSWRDVAGYRDLAVDLALSGLAAEVIGATPKHGDPEWSLVLAFLARRGRSTLRVPRGAEIATWLLHHGARQPYVVLDDCDDMPYVRRRFVQTRGSEGLSDLDVERAVRILAA